MARIAKQALSLDEVDWSAGYQVVYQQEEELIARTAAAYKERYRGELVGEVVQWPRADGYARYMVVSQRPLTLQHLAMGDAWQVEAALIRGTTVEDVQQMVESTRRINEIFAGR